MIRYFGLALVVALAACDSQTRPGSWNPIGANNANLAAMVADPEDLVTGVASRTADGQFAAAAVARYRAGKVKDLPDSLISKVAPITVNNGAPAPALQGGE